MSTYVSRTVNTHDGLERLYVFSLTEDETLGQVTKIVLSVLVAEIIETRPAADFVGDRFFQLLPL